MENGQKTSNAYMAAYCPGDAKHPIDPERIKLALASFRARYAIQPKEIWVNKAVSINGGKVDGIAVKGIKTIGLYDVWIGPVPNRNGSGR